MTEKTSVVPSPSDDRSPPVRAGQRVVSVFVDIGRASWRGVVDFYHSSDLTHASSIAYYALLSLFPFLLIVLSVLGAATASDADRAEVLDFVLRYFPRQFDFVTGQLDAFRTSRVTLGIAGTLLTIWACLGVFSAVSTAVNYAWGVERTPSYFKHQLVAFVMLATAGLLTLFALLIVTVYPYVRASWFAEAAARVPFVAVVATFVSRWSSTAILVLVVGLVFRFVPNTRVRFRDVWPGALITGLVWRGALALFSWYVADLSRFSVHGSITTVVVFLWWVFTTAVVFIYGVEFSAEYARLRAQRRGEAPAPARKLDLPAEG